MPGLVVLSLGMLVSWLIYGITPVGSILLLYGFIAVYLMAVLGLGLLISTFADTQQQAMFIARLNPVSYIIDLLRRIVLKGSGFQDIKDHLGKIVLFAIVLNGWAIWNYKKTS